ncbi:MAG: ABC transporter ATP-binding protein [bacterium]
MSPLLEARGVSKRFSNDSSLPWVLDGADLQLAPNETVSLVGASGTGKSTLLHLLGGLDRPTSGDVLCDGTSLLELSDPALSRLRGETFGFVFQDFHLQLQHSALENVLLPMAFSVRAIRHPKERANQLLEQVGLADCIHQRVADMSGGQQQRVTIARALANSPRILLADEPTAKLDPETGAQILSLLKSLKESENLTLLIVTHDPAVRTISDRVVTLRNGKIVPLNGSEPLA